MPDQDDVCGACPVGDRSPGRNGSSPDERGGLPVDLAAVQADDEMIDGLGRLRYAELVDDTTAVLDVDAGLRQVLLAWRQDVRRDDDGVPLVDVDTALAVVARAQRSVPRRRPVLMPVAAAVAMVVIAFSGLGLGARFAEPGDTLWPMTKVLYPERAACVVAERTPRGDDDCGGAAMSGGQP